MDYDPSWSDPTPGNPPATHHHSHSHSHTPSTARVEYPIESLSNHLFGKELPLLVTAPHG